MNKRITLFVIATLLFVTTAVNIQVPLYGTYAAQSGFGTGVAALAFALFIIGVLPVMFFLGGISDLLGRRAVIIAGLTLMLLATGMLILYPSIYALAVSRILQGIAFGLSLPAATAYLSETNPENKNNAAKIVTVVTTLGFGSGSLLTSLALLSGVTLVPWSYWLVLVCLIGCILLSIGLVDKKGKKGSMLRLPFYPTGSITAGLSIALAWGVSGVILTVVPTQLSKVELAGWVGLMLFLLNAFGILAQPLARRLQSKRALLLGFINIAIGFSLLVFGAGTGNLILVLIGSAISGSACYGLTYLGSLAEVVKVSGEQPARTTSGYFFIAYLGFVFPSIFVGFLSDKTSTIFSLYVFMIIVIIASITLMYIYKRPRHLPS